MHLFKVGKEFADISSIGFIDNKTPAASVNGNDYKQLQHSERTVYHG